MGDRKRCKRKVRQIQGLGGKRVGPGNQRMAQLLMDERPREKLLTQGPVALSDLELIAVLIGSRGRSVDVFSLAARILKTMDHNNSQVEVRELLEIEGVEPAMAAVVLAALELPRRRIHPKGLRISWTTDILPHIRHVCASKQEHLICVSLNGANEVLGVRTVTIGLADRVHIHAREVFADPITDRATAVIIAHNHPSGDVNPSEDDRIITRELELAGKLLGIQLLDHLIFNERHHYSFLENGDL
jgi:DNA repair protein RadC